MSDIFPPGKQRPALLAFTAACCVRSDKLRRDECGDWAIWGSNGHIYAVPEGFQLMIGCDLGNVRWTSARGWESAKKRLGFGKVMQDGDREGSIVLARLPSKDEAAEIRDILGIPKRVALSEGQLANLRKHCAATTFKPVLPASGDGKARGTWSQEGAFQSPGPCAMTAYALITGTLFRAAEQRTSKAGKLPSRQRSAPRMSTRRNGGRSSPFPKPRKPNSYASRRRREHPRQF